jgi:hypothetical protein
MSTDPYAAARARNQARHTRERKLRAQTLARHAAACEARSALHKCAKLRDTTARALALYLRAPGLGSLPELRGLALDLRLLSDDTRQLGRRCTGTIPGDRMYARCCEAARAASRLAREIDALPDMPAPMPTETTLPTLAPITPPALPEPALLAQPALPGQPTFTQPDPEPARSEYHWEKLIHAQDGTLKAWRSAQRKRYRAYAQSEKGKAARARAQARYRARRKEA